MRRWIWPVLLALGCAPEAIVEPPPAPDAGPATTARDGGVAEPDFETQLFGATGALNRVLTFPLDDPSRVTALLPPRPVDYGLPVGNLDSPMVTPDGRAIVYHYSAFETPDQYILWIDATRPQEAPTILYSASDIFIQAIAVSNTRVVVRSAVGTDLVPFDDPTNVRTLSSEVATTAHFVGDFVVLAYRAGVQLLVSHRVETPGAVILVDEVEASNPIVLGVANGRVLVRNGDAFLSIDPETAERVLVAPSNACNRMLGVSPDGAEVFCTYTSSGRSSVDALRLDGTTAEAPRDLLTRAASPIVSEDGRWLWAFSSNELVVVDTTTGTVASSSTTTGTLFAIDDITADGQYATLHGSEGGAMYDRDLNVVLSIEGFINTFDPTDRFAVVGTTGAPFAFEIATGSLRALPAFPSVFTAAGGHSVLLENGQRLYRVDGSGPAEPASEWFANGNTYTTHDDALITERRIDGLWKTPRAAGPSTKLANHGGAALMMAVNDRLVAVYATDEFDRRSVETYAMDGSDAEGSPEQWERLPEALRVAGDHLVGVANDEVVAVKVDGTQDAPRTLYTTQVIWGSAWAEAIQRLVLIEISGTDLAVVTVSLDGDTEEVARFGLENLPFFDLRLTVDGDRAYVSPSPLAGTWTVELVDVAPPTTLAPIGRLEFVFSEQRRGILLGDDEVQLIDLDTGATEPLGTSSSQFGVSVLAPSREAFAYYDVDTLKVARSIAPLETVEIGFGLGAIAFAPDEASLYHYGSLDARLYRYDFELGWSRVLTDERTTVQAVYPIDAPYPIIRAVVDSEPGVYALLEDGRLRPLLDLPQSLEFHYDTTPDD